MKDTIYIVLNALKFQGDTLWAGAWVADTATAEGHQAQGLKGLSALDTPGEGVWSYIARF